MTLLKIRLKASSQTEIWLIIREVNYMYIGESVVCMCTALVAVAVA